MSEKVSIAACSGMSALGLIGRAACNDVASENDGIVSICITATAADNNNFKNIIKKYPILAINGCSDSCVNKILDSKGVSVIKSIDIDKLLEDDNLKTADPSRLDSNGEKHVENLKELILIEVDSI